MTVSNVFDVFRGFSCYFKLRTLLLKVFTTPDLNKAALNLSTFDLIVVILTFAWLTSCCYFN